MTAPLDLLGVARGHRVVLCGGSGGVGKTTTAAALGVLAARQGQRTLVLTIDPARRLADAMGIADIGNTPTPVPGMPNLSLMMLDATASMDALVTRHAADQAAREAMLSNPYYQQIAASVAGSREFLAMEQLHALVTDARFDLLIVDTPPSQHALDFLDAPKRLLELLDGSGLGILLRTTSVANRLSFGLVGRSQKQFAKLFEKLTGHRLMLDLSAFFETFEEVIDGFRQRARAMQAQLRSSDTAFVLVQVPQPGSLAVADAYVRRLRSESMQVAGVVFNQVQQVPELAVDEAAVQAAMQAAGADADLQQRAYASYRHWRAVTVKQQELIERWQQQSRQPLLTVSFLPGNVSSLASLEQFAANLSGDHSRMLDQ